MHHACVLLLALQAPESPPAPVSDAADRAFKDEFSFTHPAFDPAWINATGLPTAASENIGDVVKDEDLVVGVEIGDATRAYPIWMLSSPEVVNDRFGGEELAVAWCKACHAPVVYDRVVDGRTLTIGNYRCIWRASMVMYDVETGSLWVQGTGECRAGPLRGKSLGLVVSSLTTWKQWKTLHPDSTVAIGDWKETEHRSRNWFWDKSAADRMGVVLRIGNKARLYPLPLLETTGAVSDLFDDVWVLVLFSRENQSMLAFRGEVDGKPVRIALAPRVEGQPQLVETVGQVPLAGKAGEPLVKRRWRADTGQPEGKDASFAPLERLVAYPMRQRHFQGLFPEGTVCLRQAPPLPATPPSEGPVRRE